MEPKRNNNKFARERDWKAFDWLDLHPSTYNQLVQAGFYPTIQKARERIAKAVRRGQVSFVGIVVDHEGYELKLFARFPVGNIAQHEYEVTAMILAAKPNGGVRRGPDVDEYLSDTDFVIDGQLKRLERDRSTERGPKLTQRIQKYADCPDPVWWIMDTKGRIDYVMNHCSPPAHHWFTTYDQAIHNFYGDIWTNTAMHKAGEIPTNAPPETSSDASTNA